MDISTPMAFNIPFVVRIERTAEQRPVATVLNTPFQNAVAAIARLQVDMKSSIGVINAANLGPYNMGGSCDYDCFIGICIKTYHWWYKLDYENLRAPLQSLVQQVGNAAGQFDSAFQPARNWLKDTLPQFSADFANQTKTILATNAAIVQAGGKATAAQIATLQAAFADIINGLNVGKQQMDTGISAMGAFNNLLNACVGQLSSVMSGAQNAINTWRTTQWSDFVNGMDCGQGDADNQANGAIGTFNAAAGQIQSSFNTLGTDGNAVATAVDQLVGTFANVNDQYGLVAGQIGTSQSYPAGAIADLHLDIAAGEWAQLAQYAQQNIQ